MAGGIFPHYPFQPNIKCVVLTAIIAGGYWWLPPKSVWVLVFLLWLPYVALAWYDYAYSCQFQMQPTLLPFGRWLFLPFKPPSYKKAYEDLPPEAKADMDTIDHITGWTLLVIAVAVACWKRETIMGFVRGKL